MPRKKRPADVAADEAATNAVPESASAETDAAPAQEAVGDNLLRRVLDVSGAEYAANFPLR